MSNLKKGKKRSYDNNMIKRRKEQAFQGGLIHPILGYTHNPPASSSKRLTEFSLKPENSNGFKSLHV